MSSTNKTETLSLNQWLGNDISARDDFNSDNKKVDDWAKEVNTSLKDKVNKTQVVNNLLTTETGFILDARVAKALKDYIDSCLENYYSLKTAINIDKNTDLNNLTELKNYYCLGGETAATLVNTPWTVGGFALKNERTTGDISGAFLMQTVIVNSNSYPNIFKRIKNNGVWGVWHKETFTPVTQ